MLGSDEGVLLALGMLLRAGDAGVAEDDVRRVAEWAAGVRLEAALLELALRGEVLLAWTGEDVSGAKSSPEQRQRFAAEVTALALQRRR